MFSLFIMVVLVRLLYVASFVQGFYNENMLESIISLFDTI